MEIYCTQLGMVVDIAYCISMNEGLPCRNLIGCWKGRMNIHQFLKEKFTEDELKRAFGKLPKTRIERLIEATHMNKKIV